MNRCIQRILLVVAAAVLGTGCQTYRDQAKNMTSAWSSGQLAQAAKEFEAKAEKGIKSKDAIIWQLEAGTACRAMGRYEDSLRHLDIAANKIDEYEAQARVKLANEVGATMSNQQNLPYRGRGYDKIMLHVYRALNYLALGEIEKARPEIIRTYQRQQDAVEENKRRIEKTREEEAKNKEKDKYEKAKADPKVAGRLDEITKDVNSLKMYEDYVNPFAVYLDGLYFLHNAADGSDLERSRKSLERVLTWVPENKFVRMDLATVSSRPANRSEPPLTYVIFETGRAPSRDQVRIDIPIIVFDVSYLGAAFPTMAFHSDYANHLVVNAGSTTENTALVASMDSIIGQDFKNEFPTIVTKTIIATVAKGVAAYAVNHAANQQDAIAGLLTRITTAVLQAVVNIADTRSWTTLPKEFQVARVATPPDRKLRISPPGAAPIDLALVDGRVNVVYVRSITANTPLVINQFKLK